MQKKSVHLRSWFLRIARCAAVFQLAAQLGIAAAVGGAHCMLKARPVLKNRGARKDAAAVGLTSQRQGPPGSPNIRVPPASLDRFKREWKKLAKFPASRGNIAQAGQRPERRRLASIIPRISPANQIDL